MSASTAAIVSGSLLSDTEINRLFHLKGLRGSANVICTHKQTSYWSVVGRFATGLPMRDIAERDAGLATGPHSDFLLLSGG